MIVCAFSEKYQFKKDLVTKIVFFMLKMIVKIIWDA